MDQSIIEEERDQFFKSGCGDLAGIDGVTGFSNQDKDSQVRVLKRNKANKAGIELMGEVLAFLDVIGMSGAGFSNNIQFWDGSLITCAPFFEDCCEEWGEFFQSLSGEYFFNGSGLFKRGDLCGIGRLIGGVIGRMIGRIDRRYFLDEDGFVQVSAIDDGRSSHNDLNGSDIDTVTKRKHGFSKRIKIRLDEA